MVVVGYVLKLVEVVVLSNNKVKNVIVFLKMNVFSRFGIPRAISTMGFALFPQSFHAL